MVSERKNLTPNAGKKRPQHKQLKTATLKDLLLLLLKKRARLKIIGRSMEPIIKNNSTILIKPVNQEENLRPGQIIAIQHPFKKNLTLIKKISTIEKNKINVIGTNKKHSTDSRSFGPILKENVIGLVTNRL